MTEMGLHFMGSLPHVRLGEAAFGLAVGQVLADRYPVHAAKMVARDLSALGSDCSIRTAENILAGHLSARTITRLVLAYGLDLLIDAGALVTGITLENFIREKAANAARERDRQEAERRRFAELQAFLITRDAPGLARGGRVVGRVAERGG